MRNRYITLLFIVFILCIAIIAGSRFGLLRKQVSIEDSLIKSMGSTKAQVMESTISAWAKINNSFMTEEQITTEVNMILEIINPDKSTVNIVKEANDSINKQTLNASIGNKHYNFAVESVKTEKGEETYAIMDVSIDNNSVELIAERQKLEKYFAAKSINPKISSCVIGVYNGKLTENEMRSKIADAMTTVKAKEVEGLKNEEINSISAFSGNINNFVLSNNKKINMQIAMRYSSYDDKTYIWIGSPLIHVEY
jgi:hypothetical protein